MYKYKYIYKYIYIYIYIYINAHTHSMHVQTNTYVSIYEHTLTEKYLSRLVTGIKKERERDTFDKFIVQWDHSWFNTVGDRFRPNAL